VKKLKKKKTNVQPEYMMNPDIPEYLSNATSKEPFESRLSNIQETEDIKSFVSNQKANNNYLSSKPPKSQK